MGNPQGEGAIWQRTPSGADVKVGWNKLKFFFGNLSVDLI